MKPFPGRWGHWATYTGLVGICVPFIERMFNVDISQPVALIVAFAGAVLAWIGVINDNTTPGIS